MLNLDELQNKTILLTGATGFIGTHLRKRLRAAVPSTKIVLLSRRSEENLQTNEISIVSSLNDFRAGLLARKGIKTIDYLIHLAGFTPKNSGEANNINENLKDNVNATYNLLKEIPNTPLRIVFSSTLDVYTSTAFNSVVKESSGVGNSTFYGECKLLCESIVRLYAEKMNCGYAILRYGHIYGPGEEAYQKIIPITIKRLMQNECPVLYGDGSVLRDFLYVEDVVEATLRAVVAKKSEVGPVNIVSGKSITMKEVVEILMGLTKFDRQINYLTDKPNGQNYVFDNKLMYELLGRWKLTNLKDGLANEVSSFVSH